MKKRMKKTILVLVDVFFVRKSWFYVDFMQKIL